MATRRTASWMALATALALGAGWGIATAHQNGLDLPEGEGAIVYVYEDHSSPSVWQETNGRASDGVYGDGTDRRAGRPPMGLHVRGACYGTFTAAQVDNWNRTFCGSTAADPYDVFSYMPFDGNSAACSNLARAIEDACDGCTDDACRVNGGCAELCGAGYDNGNGACVIAEAWYPADTRLLGVPPSYGVPGGTCHAG